MNNNDSIYQTIPPWVRLFLIHVLKRWCGILVKFIDEMQEACREEQGNDGYLRRR